MNLQHNNWKSKLTAILQSPWTMALLLTGLFYLTHGYRFPWDDQRIEVPLLKALIDPALYPRDYFILTVKNHFTTYFFWLLSRFISTEQVEPAYAALFFVSRYFMFFWMYKLWHFVAKSAPTAFLCVASFLVLLRYEMFVYWTFSHAEFAFIFMFAGIYYFYRERFVLASILLGIGANFHALFAGYAMMYVVVHLVFFAGRAGWKKLVQSLAAFAFCAAPLLIWYGRKVLAPQVAGPEAVGVRDWQEIYRELVPYFYMYGTGPLAQIFSSFWNGLIRMQLHLLLLVLFVFNVCHNRDFRRTRQNYSVLIAVVLSLVVYFLAAYVFPCKGILDLSLSRQEGVLIFLVGGATTWTLWRAAAVESAWLMAVLGMMYFAAGDKSMVSVLAVTVGVLVLYVPRAWRLDAGRKRWAVLAGLGAAIVLVLWGIVLIYRAYHINPLDSAAFNTVLASLVALGVAGQFLPERWRTLCKRLCVIVPLLICVQGYVERKARVAHQPETPAAKLRADWKDMELYVKDNTPKDALFLIPYDMPFHNFRIFAERSVVFTSDADASLIIFDVRHAAEYEQRQKDFEPFKMIAKDSVRDAVVRAIAKYKVDYILFPLYYAPPSTSTLEVEHTTKFLGLYKVNHSL